MTPAHPREFVYLLPSSLETGADGTAALAWPTGSAPFGGCADVGENNALQTIQLRPGALSADECRQVIAVGENLPRAAGRVELGDDAYRVSHIAWIEPAPQTHWLFHRLGVLFLQAGKHYGFELTGFLDAFQYTVYGAGQHFGWHMDLGPGATSARKLSMTLQLSDAGEYSGGMLEFINAPTSEQSRPVGSAIFFPSYLAHRVAPVESGVRRSLVAWACGPTFR